MSRITHFKVQPKNIQYWDYYILCHLDVYAAIALQRFEYWDGTKRDGNVHAEDINDILEDLGEEMTQDASRFFYKAQDELQWELMGLTGEKYTANLINFLIKDLNYLEQRNNPSNAMDRKKQYLFHDELVQDHINYLGYIIDYFKRLGFRLNPIYYAIEQLTASKVYIDTLNVALVSDKFTEMYAQMEEDETQTKESKKYKPNLPKFIRLQLGKDKNLLPRLKANKLKRFRNFAEWKAQICGMESAETRDATCKNAETNPQDCGSNSNNYKQQLQTTTTDSKNEPSHQKSNVTTQGESHSFTPSQSQSSFSSSEQKEEIIFSPEAEQVYQLAEKLHITYLKRDEKHRDNCLLLVEKGVTTQEKMESLIQHCRQVPFLQGKALNLKNLVNELSAWLQLQRKTTVAPSSSSVTSPMAKATAERLAKEEEIKRKILEQDAARVGPRPSLREIQAHLVKQRK